jgi:hypothetical protein
MSVLDVERLVSELRELSAIDQRSFMQHAGEIVMLSSGSCEICGNEPATVCDGCYEAAFDDGVSEAAIAAESVSSPRKVAK